MAHLAALLPMVAGLVCYVYQMTGIQCCSEPSLDMICHASKVLLGLSKEALSLSQKKVTDLPTQSKNVAQEKLDAAIKEHAAAQEVGIHTCCLS